MDIKKLLGSENINRNAFLGLFDHTTTSYKFFFFKAILDEIKSGHNVIMLNDISNIILKKGKKLIVDHHLSFGIQDKLQNAILDNENNITDSIIKPYVLFRTLRPFCNIPQGTTDAQVNNLIRRYSANYENDCLYQLFDEQIIIKQNYFEFIFLNSAIIEGWVDMKLVDYLQTKNPAVPAIPFKLKDEHTRKLQKPTELWQKLRMDDFYTQKPFTQENIIKFGKFSIDHFIPHSYVMHDEYWNLVPTFKNINSSKSNRLPNFTYLEHYKDYQWSFYNEYKSEKRISDSYAPIYTDENEHEFKESLQKYVTPQWQIAKNSGYSEWRYCENNIKV